MAKPLTMLAAGLMPALALTACQTLAPAPADPRIASLADAIHDRAEAFYTALAAEPAPACGFDSHGQDHADLIALAARLQGHVAASRSSKALRRAADALARTIDKARESHRLASAVTTDPAGPCLAPAALALNADAIARASKAISHAR